MKRALLATLFSPEDNYVLVVIYWLLLINSHVVATTYVQLL